MIKVTAAITGIMFILLGFMFHKYTVAVETSIKFQVAAETAQIAADYKDETARLSQQNADIKAQADANLVTAQNEFSREINIMRATYEKDLRNQPFDTGNAFEHKLAIIMCKISSDNPDSRKACDIQATAPYTPDTSLIVTVTSDTADFWREQCEDGISDFCDYAIVGMTTQGALTILDYLNQVDRYIQQWKTLNEYDGKIIEAIQQEPN